MMKHPIIHIHYTTKNTNLPRERLAQAIKDDLRKEFERKHGLEPTIQVTYTRISYKDGFDDNSIVIRWNTLVPRENTPEFQKTITEAVNDLTRSFYQPYPDITFDFFYLDPGTFEEEEIPF